MVDTLQLTEAASGAKPLGGSKWRAKIIAADTWGSTAYYPAAVLERDGARVFTAGTHMYENHATENEMWERPEGDVKNLVGVLESDAAFVADDPDGPGLYAEVSFYPSYVERITEIHKDVGLSVRAQGLTEDGEMAGRYGPILQGILSASSVDVVTKAGAGGKLTSIIESDRSLAGRPVEQEGTQSTMTDVTKEDFESFATELREAISAIPAALAEALKPVVVEGAVELEESNAEDKVVIDNAAVLTAVAEAQLPAAAFTPIVNDLKAGVSLVEAVKKQADYRDSLVEGAGAEVGVVIRESGSKPTGLARAVEILGK